MRTGSAAIAWAIAQHQQPTMSWVGMCQMFTRSCFGVPSAPGYGSAAEAWHRAAHTHPGDAHPPPAVPVHWTGGSSGNGHAALSAGGGYIWTTDLLHRGRVDKAPLSMVHARWGLTYAGWAEDIDGVRVYTAPPAPPSVVVHLSHMQTAARKDPSAPQGHAAYPAEGKLVEAALVREGLLDDRWAADGAFGQKTVTAYARWQQRLGFSGADANGVPGMKTLTDLGAKHGFEVAA